MARFDVYSAAGDTGKSGYLLDVQADLLGQLNTRIVVPLMPRTDAPAPAEHLNPEFDVLGLKVVMVTQFMAAVPKAELKQQLMSLDKERLAILAAIDFLHQGW